MGGPPASQTNLSLSGVQGGRQIWDVLHPSRPSRRKRQYTLKRPSLSEIGAGPAAPPLSPWVPSISRSLILGFDGPAESLCYNPRLLPSADSRGLRSIPGSILGFCYSI